MAALGGYRSAALIQGGGQLADALQGGFLGGAYSSQALQVGLELHQAGFAGFFFTQLNNDLMQPAVQAGDLIFDQPAAFTGPLAVSFPHFQTDAPMRQTLANAEQNLRTTEALSTQGLVSEYDRLRAAVAVENLRPELLNIENGLQLALNNLKAIIGVRYDRPVAVEGRLEFVPVDSAILIRAQEKVLTENHALAWLRLQSEVNDAIISAQKSEYLPVLSAFGTYQYVAQSNAFNISTSDFISASTVGLSLSLNIFNGLQSNARVEQAELEYRKSQEQVLANLELRLQASTEAVLLNLEKARLRIISLRTRPFPPRSY